VTTVASIEIESYYDRVRAALDGLAPDTRDDLLEDLPDHLAEVLAEGEGSLRDRLGEPEAYADELRAAAGVEPAAVPTAHGVHRALERGLARGSDLVRRFDVQAGRFAGYPRLMDLLRALSPGWWVLRGWIVAQFICGAHHGSWNGFIPRLGNSWPAGLLCTMASIAVSVWMGRRCAGFAVWPRRIMAAASVVIALWAVLVLASSAGATTYGSGASYDSYGPQYGSDVSDVYVYDKDGNAVVGARLFDQDGNPIQIGSTYCLDGSAAPGTGPDGTALEWTYPLCPTGTGPFRSGPGPLPATAAVPPAPAPSGSATTSPSNTPTAKSTAKASPSH
jgi:hypothetical protein